MAGSELWRVASAISISILFTYLCTSPLAIKTNQRKMLFYCETGNADEFLLCFLSCIKSMLHQFWKEICEKICLQILGTPWSVLISVPVRNF